MLNKKSVDDINVKGKKVLVRCDFNVPLKEGKITDENRLVAALPTIKKLIADGGKVILCSHLGKPKGEPKPELSLAPVAVRLSELLGIDVGHGADEALRKLIAAHFEREDGHGELLAHADVFGDVDGERRLAHRGTACDDDQVAALHAGEFLVEVRVSGRDARDVGPLHVRIDVDDAL